MNTLRAFIAIDIPPEIKKAISAHTLRMQNNSGRSVRWVTPENTHLTLKFLGEISPANIDLLAPALQSECSQAAPFEIIVSGMGCFPNARRPRVIWVGLQAPAALKNLQTRIESAAARLGFANEEKPFSPHLTIGRVREQASPDDLKLLQASIESTNIGTLGTFTVQEVILFKSDLQPAGPIYSHLFGAKLG